MWTPLEVQFKDFDCRIRTSISLSPVCGKQRCNFVRTISVHAELQKTGLVAWYHICPPHTKWNNWTYQDIQFRTLFCFCYHVNIYAYWLTKMWFLVIFIWQVSCSVWRCFERTTGLGWQCSSVPSSSSSFFLTFITYSSLWKGIWGRLQSFILSLFCSRIYSIGNLSYYATLEWSRDYQNVNIVVFTIFFIISVFWI